MTDAIYDPESGRGAMYLPDGVLQCKKCGEFYREDWPGVSDTMCENCEQNRAEKDTV